MYYPSVKTIHQTNKFIIKSGAFGRGEAVRKSGGHKQALPFYFHITLLALWLCLTGCGSEGNHPPTANAGPNRIVTLGDRVTLNADLSSDVDGDTLIYVWELIERPEFSVAELSQTNQQSPSLNIDQDGTYQIKLIVSDGKSFSAADFITINTVNDLPVAKMLDVTPNKTGSYFVGDTILLDAAGSFDPERQDILFHWDIILQPETSSVVLESINAQNTQFEVDLAGTYIVHLVVDDGVNQSIPATIIINVQAVKNTIPGIPIRTTYTKPIAEAGLDQPLFKTGTLIQLDGSASNDAENDPLSYEWKFLVKPENSRTKLSDSTSERPLFTTDILGTYVIQLIVDDGVDGRSLIDTVVITPHYNTNANEEENIRLYCGDCHNNEIANGKPENHLLTYDDCQSCHSTTKFQPNTKTFHPHGDKATPFVCEVCHNGLDATGKADNHIITDVDCNACHVISNEIWVPVKQVPTHHNFTHEGITSGCVECHDGLKQTGKPAGHKPSSSRCSACHSEFSGWLPAKSIEHTPALASCSLCHDDKKEEKIKPENHLNSTNNCLACHNINSWLPVNFDHSETFGVCFDCHNGIIKSGKNAHHLPTSNFCGGCHSVVDWNAVFFDHDHTYINCVSCHGGFLDTSFDGHVLVSGECDACHTTDYWVPVLKVDHQHSFGNCVICHDGKRAQGRSGNHINSTDLCDACHSIKSFKPITLLDHGETIGNCASCHDGLTTKGKFENHIFSTDFCSACHSTAGWDPAIVVDHNEVLGSCRNCHNGFISGGQPDIHLITFLECNACHSTSAWSPIKKVDHANFRDDCNVCHDNKIARWKKFDHINVTNNCDACHSVLSFNILVNVDHNEVLERKCVSCHNGVIARGKEDAANHFSTTDECEGCHVTTGWEKEIIYDHYFFVDYQCVDCHDGINFQGQTVDHFLTKLQCNACHNTKGFLDIEMVDHDLVIGVCIDCHQCMVMCFGPHILTTEKCDSCHKSFESWAFVGSVKHSEVIGDCLHCHEGISRQSHELGDRSSPECQNCHSTMQWLKVIPPLHNSTLQSCMECHNNIDATGKPIDHIPVSDNCNVCHLLDYWAPVERIVHQETIGDCVSCHSGNIATKKPFDHIKVKDECDGCHFTTTFVPIGVAPDAVIEHSKEFSSHGCEPCHGAPASHIGMKTNKCGFCHTEITWFNPILDHTQLIGKCDHCHGSKKIYGYENIPLKPQGHVQSNDICENCHTSNTFEPALSLTHYYIDLSQPCANCHNNQPISHISLSVNENCESCHVVSAWFPQARSLNSLN